MSYKEQARLTQEACNVLMARLDGQKATCEAMENELLQRHAQRELLEAAAGGANMNDRTTLLHKKLVTQGRDLVDISSCVSLRAVGEEGDEEEEKIVMTANKLTESDTEDEGDDEVYNLRREHQQAAARKSQFVRHAVKVAMQVEDAKEAVELLPWKRLPVEVKPPCPISTSEYVAESRVRVQKSEEIASLPQHRYNADKETQESESDSDFADDEMSPAIHLSKDASNLKDNDSVLVSELSQFHEGPTSDLRDFCTRNSKPGESVVDYAFDHGQAPVPGPALDTPIPSAGESRLDSKREVQKDVIMVQTESSNAHGAYECIDTAALYKQEYLDELLQQIRFQIPTTEVAGEAMADSLPCMPEGHLDELLEQVLTTHLDNIRRNDAKQEHLSSDTDDEKLREIGKSNLDKWLQVLLFKDAESACSSPGRDTPRQINSPALSSISVAAMRESLERATHEELMSRDGENAERPRSLWGALLRKLTVKHQSEHDSMLFHAREDHAGDEPQTLPISNSDAVNSLLTTSPNHELSPLASNGSTLAEGRRSSGDACTLPGWPGGIQLPGIAANYSPKVDDSAESNTPLNDPLAIWKTDRRVEDGVPSHALEMYPPSLEKRQFPRPLSDVDEASETESCADTSHNPRQTLICSHAHESKDLQLTRPKKSVSVKVAGFVGWKKASKKSALESQDPTGMD